MHPAGSLHTKASGGNVALLAIPLRDWPILSFLHITFSDRRIILSILDFSNHSVGLVLHFIACLSVAKLFSVDLQQNDTSFDKIGGHSKIAW